MLASPKSIHSPLKTILFSNLLGRPYSSFKVPEIVERDFEKSWRQMDLVGKYDIQQRHAELSKMDWNTLTLATKKSMYTSAYDLPPKEHPTFSRDVTIGVAAVMLLAYGLHSFFKWVGGPPPHTASPEWYEHTKALMRKQNASPIRKHFDD
ncbi:Cytochrome c oxidase subunit 5B [Mitosporidium daphniae]